MELIFVVIAGLFVGYLVGASFYSWYKPKVGTAMIITLFGKIFTVISNIEGKKIYLGETNKNQTKYDLIDGKSVSNISYLGDLNLYFFLWPFFKAHSYPLTHIKAKRKGEEAEGDVVVWTSQDNRDILISRSGISNYNYFRGTYPMISAELETSDFGTVRIYTDNVLELINPVLAASTIDNWMQFSSNILDGAFRGVVSTLSLVKLNEISTGEENSDSFSEKICNLVNGKTTNNDNDTKKLKLGDIGFKLVRSVFKDYEPIGEKTKKMMDAISQKMINEKDGDAKIVEADKASKVMEITATAKAKAYSLEQEAIVLWQKKMLVDTGLAEVDEKGKIVRLIPDANTKAWSEAMAKLSEITGTLVMDSGSISKMLNINK